MLLDIPAMKEEHAPSNEFSLRLLELPPLETIPPHQRSTIHFLFHPDFRARSTINAEARAMWQKHVLCRLPMK
jgi:hypothetical protein